MNRARLLVLNAPLGVLDYRVPQGMTVEPGSVVVAPLGPRQIVGVCGISSPSLAGVLARMDDLGLVTRVRLDHDQRRVRVSNVANSLSCASTSAAVNAFIKVLLPALV